MAVQIPGVGALIEARSEDGCRHYVRANELQMVSEADAMGNETVVTAGGRTVTICEPMDDFLVRVRDAQVRAARNRLGYVLRQETLQ